MKLSKLLSLISDIASNKGISTPFICGGVPRDKILNKINELNDVDLTTGDDTIHSLAKELSMILRPPQASYIVMPDGHSTININEFKLDFSSNFVVPNINILLNKIGIVKPTKMQEEIFSRDFTCNSLLMSLDLKTILDPSNKGIKDIKSKQLKTCLEPDITLKLDNKRIVRILYLAAKLDFTVDSEIIQWVKNNPQSLSNVKPQYLSKKLQKAIDYNLEKTVNLITEMNLWKYTPPLPNLLPYMSKRII